SQRPCFLIAQAASIRQPPRDLLVSIEFGEVFRRRNQRDLPIEPARRLADRDQLDSIRTGCESAKVLARVVITGEVEIVTRLVPEYGLRRGHRLRQRRMNTANKQQVKKYCSSF